VLAVLSAAAGCHQPAHERPIRARDPFGIACAVFHESDRTSASIDHVQVPVPDCPPPRTPGTPEGAEVWELSLEDATRIALENARVLRTRVGTGVTAGRVTTYDPAILETAVDEALAVFDTNLALSMFWNRIDQPSGTTFGGGIPIPVERDQATFQASLTKLLAAGGTAGINYNTNYLFLPRLSFPGSVNPQHSPNVEFTFRQPLLARAGVDVNRAPIVIARLQSDQSVWDLKQSTLSLVRSVESAYWSLDAAYTALRTVEQVIPLAGEVVRVSRARLDTGKAIPADVGQAEVQLHQFRQQRTRALAAVLAEETSLRNLMGLPPSDARRIVPKDLPWTGRIAVDWASTLQSAFANRPDVVRQRLAVRVRELQMLIARNQLKPQVDVSGLWRVNGLAAELDDAIDLLSDNRFQDWQLGFSINVPLGFRAESARLQAAELQHERDRALLTETAHQAVHELSDVVRDLDALHDEYLAAVARRRSAEVWLEGARTRFENPVPAVEGQDALLLALNVYLQALSSWSAASNETAALLARYNTSLARLEEAKGTLLDVSNIQLQEDPCRALHANQPPLALDLYQVSEHSHEPPKDSPAAAPPDAPAAAPNLPETPKATPRAAASDTEPKKAGVWRPRTVEHRTGRRAPSE
jgi:outer membrane protein TolC